MARYRSADEDSAWWDGFAFRPGDILISTRSKHGTTWAQMIGVLKDRAKFFRRGGSGGGRELLTAEELADYERRAAALAPADVRAWLHR